METMARLNEFAERFHLDVGSRTIDQFLSTLDAQHPHERELKEHGKMAVAAVLGACENPSFKGRDWYDELAQVLLHFDAGNPLSVVTFNYDRSLEFILSTKFRATSQLGRANLGEICRIVHVYGILAGLPGNGTDFPVEYGQLKSNGWNAWRSREALKFIWDNPTESTLEICCRCIQEAEYVVILGFGFDQMNMRRIGLTSLPVGKCLFSSGYGLSQLKRAEIQSTLQSAQICWGNDSEQSLSFLRRSQVLRWAAQGRSAHDLVSALAASRETD